MDSASAIAQLLERTTGGEKQRLRIGHTYLSDEALAAALSGRTVVDAHVDWSGVLVVLDDERVLSVSQRVTYDDSWLEYEEIHLG